VFICAFVWNVVMSVAAILRRTRHATKHFNQTGHPVMRSFEPGENWGWCYIDTEIADIGAESPWGSPDPGKPRR